MIGKIKRNVLHKKTSLFASLSVLLTITTASWGYVYATPVNKDATGATVTNTSDTQLTVNQTAASAVLNWNSFNIAANEKVIFNQPGATAIAFNKILDTNASQIMGQLTANGHIFLQNPNGIIFARGAKVDVGGLVATTLQTKFDISGNNTTYTITNGTGGKITNEGDITARNGYVSLIAPQVENYGTVNAAKGVNMNTGVQTVSYDLMGDGKVTLKLDSGNLANTKGLNEATTMDGLVVVGGVVLAGQTYGADGNPSGVYQSARNEIYGKGIAVSGTIANLGGGNSVINATGSMLSVLGSDLQQTGKGRLTAGEYVINLSANPLSTDLTVSGKQLLSGNGRLRLPNGNLVIYDSTWNDNRGMASLINPNHLASNLLGISSANSLVGSYSGDKVSSGGIVTVGGGNNYLVVSPYWQAAPYDNRGAVTWASGVQGVIGEISSANSLVGSTRDDQIGSNGIYVFKNGNYAVLSPNYTYQLPGAAAINCGAITWGDGSHGVKGVVDASQNSLVGTFGTDSSRKEGDMIGQDVTTSLANYVTVLKGNDNTANNNIATKSGTLLKGGITEFSNGDYAVVMPYWNGGTGAVVFAKSTEPLQGKVSTGLNGNALGGFYAAKDYAKDPQQDSLNQLDASVVPVTTGDQLGSGGIVEYNGKYVMLSPNWGNGRGLVSILDTSCTNTVNRGGVQIKNYKDAAWTGANASIYTGVFPNSFVGSGGLADLGSGKLAILSPQYTYIGQIEQAVATNIDYGKLTTSAINLFLDPKKTVPDLIGTVVNKFANYYTQESKPNMVNAALTNAGAVTVVDIAKRQTTPLVNSASSLIGGGRNENFGSQVKMLSNGNLLVADPTWDGNRGALAFIPKDNPPVGAVSEANSLTARKWNSERVLWAGYTLTDKNLIASIHDVYEVGNSNYLLLSPNYTFDNDAGYNPLKNDAFHQYVKSGIIVWGDGRKGAIGNIAYGKSVDHMISPENFYCGYMYRTSIWDFLKNYTAVGGLLLKSAVVVNNDGSYAIVNWNYAGVKGGVVIHANGNQQLVGMIPKKYDTSIYPQGVKNQNAAHDSWGDILNQSDNASMETTEQLQEEGNKAVDEAQNKPLANKGNITVDSSVGAGTNDTQGNTAK